VVLHSLIGQIDIAISLKAFDDGSSEILTRTASLAHSVFFTDLSGEQVSTSLAQARISSFTLTLANMMILSPLYSKVSPLNSNRRFKLTDSWAHSLASSQRVWCGICDTEFYATKALARHFDDFHAEPEKCTRCDFKFIGKRKYKEHLKRAHNIALPSLGRARKKGKMQRE
jgi:uncharacterized C2H2 Zn-finger protein